LVPSLSKIAPNGQMSEFTGSRLDQSFVKFHCASFVRALVWTNPSSNFIAPLLYLEQYEKMTI
jgi:hypothetical protein